MIDATNIHLVDEIAEVMCRDPEFDTSQFPTSEVDNILDFFREADCSGDAIPPTLDVEYSPLKKLSDE